LDEQKQDPKEPLFVHEDTGSAPFIAINKKQSGRLKIKKRKNL
jgi:hypothetical protein